MGYGGDVRPPGEVGQRSAISIWVIFLCLALAVVGAVACTSGAAGPVARPSPSLSASPSASPANPIEEIFKAQGQALLRGDEQGWLADVDPTRPQAITRYRSLFRLLRQLRVSGWDTHITKPPVGSKVTVGVAYCFGTRSCPKWEVFRPTAPQTALNVDFVYRGGRIVLTDFRPSPDGGVGGNGLIPWGDMRLTVAEGNRVVAAAAPGATRWLDEAVAAGDRAAVVDDRFVLSGAPPERYIVYLATKAEWTRWFGGDNGQYVLGSAVPLGRQFQVILNMDEYPEGGTPLQVLMQHELGHVATLTGNRSGGGIDWLTEGIAEYIAYQGRPWSANPLAGTVRQWIRGHGWSGTRSLPAYVPETLSLAQINVFYGESHLMVRCLASRYGEEKMLRYFKIVVVDDDGIDEASRAVFGAGWDTVDRGCASFVRNA